MAADEWQLVKFWKWILCYVQVCCGSSQKLQIGLPAVVLNIPMNNKEKKVLKKQHEKISLEADLSVRLATPLHCPVQAGEQELRAEERPRGQEGGDVWLSCPVSQVGLDLSSQAQMPQQAPQARAWAEKWSPGPPGRLLTAFSPLTGPKLLHKHLLK